MGPKRKIYALKAINQIPRILSNMDRNEFSPTYGCLHRDYWLDKTSDFPDAVRQFSVHALALVYKYEFEKNQYYQNENVAKWAIAGLKYWSSIQHSDGSFDEFYPNERGWVGPTAFTAFTSAESYKILKSNMSLDDQNLLEKKLKKSAEFIIKGNFEEDHLANHHAMACLAVWKINSILNEKHLADGYKKLWKGFKEYCNFSEGWALEYDGIDPGYLSATISFLAKIYQDNNDQEILKFCKKFIETCGLFVYPNGFYAGSTGSRNTLHFYTHGFEIFAKEFPLSRRTADKMLIALEEDKLVPPEIMSDRYMGYRVPEYLQSYLDYSDNDIKTILPYEEESFYKLLHDAGIWTNSNSKHYIVVNLAKGGVIKIFDKINNKSLINDSGIILKVKGNQILSSQWVDNDYKFKCDGKSFIVEGNFNLIPSNKYFDIKKFIIFRIFLFSIGWLPFLSHKLKGTIRKILMLGNRRKSITFSRSLEIKDNKIIIVNTIRNEGKLRVLQGLIGEDVSLRYVPQSRYFQSQELHSNPKKFTDAEIDKINTDHFLEISTIVE